jgi:hypothetical protein
MLVKETIAAYSENHKIHKYPLCVQNSVFLTKAGGAYNYHCVFNDYRFIRPSLILMLFYCVV